MKAILSPRSGSPEVLVSTDVPKPIPGDADVLVRVEVATVTRGDVLLRKMPRIVLSIVGTLAGFKPMQIPGVEFAGTVEAVGQNVYAFAPGDTVCGTTTGLRYGANAEYVCVPESSKTGVLVKREGLSVDQAAASLVGGMTAEYLVRKTDAKQGDAALVYGASGSVGTFAVQLLRHRGATVTAVCSEENAELLRGLGADRVIDYRSSDWESLNRTYDVVFDAVGKLQKKRRRALVGEGSFVSVRSMTKENVDLVKYVHSLVASGSVTVTIDREYTLEQVPEAHAYVESGRKRGNVIVRIAQSS